MTHITTEKFNLLYSVRCDEGRIGRLCECSKDEVRTEDLDANCRKDNGTDICSNNGDCVCGTCECKKRENPAEIYSGKYCECDNFNCDRSNNKLCGGEDCKNTLFCKPCCSFLVKFVVTFVNVYDLPGHGRCECRKCICDANYTGSACDCSLETSTCLAKNGQICNGRGTCECGICKCTDPKFQGPTCEICPTCPGVCVEHKWVWSLYAWLEVEDVVLPSTNVCWDSTEYNAKRRKIPSIFFFDRDCVQCRAFGSGEKKDTCQRDCNYFEMVKVKDRDGLPQPTDQSFPLTHCKQRDENDCWFLYTYAIRNQTKEVFVVEQLGMSGLRISH